MKVAAFSLAAGLVVATPSPDVLSKFQAFRVKWGRQYVGTEFTRRLAYFEKHVADIEFLQQIEQGTAVYSHLGPFADASPEEMAQRKGLSQPGILEEVAPVVFLNSSVPPSLDWVAKGCVNPIQNQGDCGSCWAFSTVANLEGAGCVSNGRLVKLSEQNIVDCDKNDYGCDGGWPYRALTWSSNNGGVASEQNYPYQGSDGTCRNLEKLVQNTGYVSIGESADQIKQALVKYGPLSIVVDASPFQGYSGGIMQNPSCSQDQFDHAINLVGYSSGGGLFYWKIRNSWGESWGEEGYIRIAGDCTCGLCKKVVTATGVTISNSPTPPGPSPPGPSPPTCHDSSSWCPSSSNWECMWLASSCLKSCGCCGGGNPSSYCPSPSPTPPSPNPPSPNPPSPSPPGPSPTPPGPAPCTKCEWNSECPSGQSCYYPSSSASSGCCSASPPYDHDESASQAVAV